MGNRFTVIDEVAFHQYFPIRPIDIPAGKPDGFSSTFGKYEVEKAAEKLVLFFQSKGLWCKFTLHELFLFYLSQEWDANFAFFGLMGAWFDDGPYPEGQWLEASDVYLAITDTGHYCVTDRFIERCAKRMAVKAG